MPFQTPTTLPEEQDQLACANQVGSLNSTTSTPAQNGTNNTALAPYVAPNLPIGTWQITGINPDQCAINEQLNQQTYVAESLNISGAPINIYPLLGVHQQGNGSILSSGTIFTSSPAPGYPSTGINVSGQSWRSLQTGSSISGTAFVGIDFGIKLLSKDGNPSEYSPPASNLLDVGAVMLTQSNTPGYYAQQVRVDITSGDVQVSPAIFSGVGNGTLTGLSSSVETAQGTVTAQATSSTSFNVFFINMAGTSTLIGTATTGVEFNSTIINFTINSGTTAFVAGDLFTIQVNYIWSRVGVFNIIQSPSQQALNLQTVLKARAIRIVPTLFTGTGNWEVDALDVLDSPPTSINNIQDLFLNENRDRDYNTTPVLLKCAYTPSDSSSDLSKFGLNILDQYTFTCSFATMVSLIGRPIVVGDIVEVIPELQWGQDLKPIRKFLEVNDAGWASAGFGPAYNATVYRFTAQQALPSQETRDIFGTPDTEKYLVSDPILANGIGQQVDITQLVRTEEITKKVNDAVPQTGSDDNRSIAGIVERQALPPRNAKGQLAADTNPPPEQVPNLYIEDGLPPNGEAYTEGYKLPAVPGPADGAYFRLYYPPELNILPRLYRFSVVKNAWMYCETDRRSQYTSLKPSVQKIMQSPTKVSINKKQT